MDNEVKEIFMRTVTLGTLKNVQTTFKEHKLIQDETYFDYELLMTAFARNHLSIVNFLLNHCRVRNPKKAHLEEAVVHLAMRLITSSSDLTCSILRKVLKNGACISDKDHDGETALYVGFKGGYQTAVSIALTHMCKVYKKNLKANVASKLKPLNPKDKDDILHFHIACVTEHNDAVKLFVRHGFDVNSPISLDSAEYAGLNPLLYVANKGSYIFESFLGNGDLSIKNSKGQTPLQILYYNSLTYMIESAFKKGNDTKFTNSVDNNGVSHFLLCCSVNCPDMVKAFINKGADINSIVSLNCSVHPGFTALHFAVRYNCEEIVELLLESGADSNKVDKEGSTPLHLAIEYNDIKIVKLLLENGADSNKKDARGNTPLHLACDKYTDVNKTIKILVDYGACPAAVNEDRFTPLHKAFCNKKIKNDTVDILTAKIPREVDFVNKEGLSHFHIVCTRKDVTRVNDFLKSGVGIDSCVSSGNCAGYTALHFAVLFSQTEVVEILLKVNAQVNIKTKNYQEIPLHFACDFNNLMIEFHEMNLHNIHRPTNCNSHVDIVKLLLRYGSAHIDAQNSLGVTPLIIACTIYGKIRTTDIRHELEEEIKERTKEIIKILISNKANVNARTKCQESILHIMGGKYFPCMPDLVEYLISQGADINAIDDIGLTPLHNAVKSVKKELVQIYLKHKADVYAKSKDSFTPLHLALNNYYKHYSLSDEDGYQAGEYDDSDEDYENDEDDEYLRKKDEDIICALLENGSDVNVMDQQNDYTLLQESIAKRTNFVVEKLLYYGADINMEDSSFSSSTLSSLFDWDNPIHWSDYTKLKCAALLQIIFTHVQKLLALGSYVSEKVKTTCTKLHQLYKKKFFTRDDSDTDNLDSTFDNCVEELNGMKLIKIDGYTSLFNILQKDIHELSKHVRNSTLVNILEDQNIDNNFPFYSFLLRLKYKKGLKRSDVLQFAKSSLTRVIGLNLPDLCCDLVLKYLTNEEIINLNAVARSSCKRKLQNNCSNDTEPSAKLQKMQ